jgi:hypothetical protein
MTEKSNAAVLKYATNKVAELTSLELAIDGNVIEVNSFDTEAIAQAILGRRTVTISVEGNLDHTDTNGQIQLRTDYLDATKSKSSDFGAISIGAETPTTGDRVYNMAGFPTSYNESRGDDGDGIATFSSEFRITAFAETVTA